MLSSEGPPTPSAAAPAPAPAPTPAPAPVASTRTVRGEATLKNLLAPASGSSVFSAPEEIEEAKPLGLPPSDAAPKPSKMSVYICPFLQVTTHAFSQPYL